MSKLSLHDGLRGCPRHLKWWMGAMLYLLSWTFLPAQGEDPYLEHFSISKDDGKVLLRWVTRPGTTCEGIDIVRSTDGVNYVPIHHIPGICGGPTTSISYSHVDDMPVLNQTNHYRLELGRVGTTTARSIEVVALGKEGYLLKPSPLMGVSRLYFENPQHETCRLTLYNMGGIPVHSQETADEFFWLDGAQHLPGLYILHIEGADGGFKAKGRLLVSKYP